MMILSKCKMSYSKIPKSWKYDYGKSFTIILTRWEKLNFNKKNMKQIRHWVFETNSSSTHSLSIREWEQLIPQILDNQKYFRMACWEFWWEVSSYSDFTSKVSYVITGLLSYWPDVTKDDEILPRFKQEYDQFWWLTLSTVIEESEKNKEELQKVFDVIKEKIPDMEDIILEFSQHSCYPFWYVDHQSSDVPFEAFEDLEQFFFCNSSYFETDNDNH